jgi:hypothetical protein
VFAKQYFVGFLFLSVLPSSALADVSVRVSATTVKYRVFDPAKPPAEMPHLSRGEAAVTVCGFEFLVEPQYEVVGQHRGADGNWTVEIAVHGVGVSVRQSIVIWTPKGVTAKLKAHEEGHRRLDEMMYKRLAQSAARAAGDEMDGHHFTGEGSSVAAAVNIAVQTMFQHAGADYLAQTAKPNDEINATYDSITAHGTNNIPEDQAIQQALERYDQDHLTTRPAEETK